MLCLGPGVLDRYSRGVVGVERAACLHDVDHDAFASNVGNQHHGLTDLVGKTANQRIGLTTKLFQRVLQRQRAQR